MELSANTHTHTHLIIGGGQYAIFKSDTFRVNSTHLVNIISLLNRRHETNGRLNTVATGTKLEYKTTLGPLLFIDEIRSGREGAGVGGKEKNYSVWFL